MRFVYYIDQWFTGPELEKFQTNEKERFGKAGMLSADDSLVVIPRPGYITQLEVLVGE